MFSWFIRFIGFIFFFIAPFLLLIRGAVFAHTTYNTHAWISVLFGGVLTTILLLIYMSVFLRKITGKRGSVSGLKHRFMFLVILVFGFAFQGLMFISAENVKQKSLQTEFRQLHPILRLSLSTILILDRKAIMTGAARIPEDYKKMGLKTNGSSLHYRQIDGFVYAIDLRTNGRSEIRNRLLQLYFQIMGFRTLRHVGTSDHLHVSLKNIGKPWAK